MPLSRGVFLRFGAREKEGFVKAPRQTGALGELIKMPLEFWIIWLTFFGVAACILQLANV